MLHPLTKTGGARIGIVNVSWPFVKLTVTEDAIQLSRPGPNYHFPKESIRSLSRHRGVVTNGLRIEHNNSSLPEFIVFWPSLFCWSSDFQKLKTQIEELGHTVQE
ncbi:hypothetical protein [Calycomorphotria hydatis]|uniref:Uncharacterized protein n=1 Tax=Calycomorphotria hydatis TaxID=2528027 RepID=A0A517T421_9PLAN|nr:hypothetical protein [Calycomorphotria hydatis]QDT63101.1 hypothetical protein V22_03010 [Calycomorphotria hydatis]